MRWNILDLEIDVKYLISADQEVLTFIVLLNLFGFISFVVIFAALSLKQKFKTSFEENTFIQVWQYYVSGLLPLLWHSVSAF